MKTTLTRNLSIAALILMSAVVSNPGARAQGPAGPADRDKLVLATGDLVPCEICRAQARRRVAVMPVNIGEIPERLAMAPASAAERVRSQIEARLAASPSMIAVNRSHLDAVLAEQKLAASPVASAGGRLRSGGIVPAQILLYTTVERLDVSKKTDRQTSDGTTAYRQDVEDLEAKASEAAGRLADIGDQAELLEAAQGLVGPSMTGMLGTNLDLSARVESQRARRFKAAADDLRARARSEAVKTLDERVDVVVSARFGWSAVDVSTGTVVAQGSTTVQQAGAREAHVSENAAGSSARIEDTPDSIIVNQTVDRAVARMAAQVEDKLSQEPFRAKVAAVRGDEVVINAGALLGLRPGDLFGVRRAAQGIVDPDTGLPLLVDGDPVGAIHVERVQDNVAFGRVIRAAGQIHPADELQWVGLLVARGDLPRLQEEAAQRNRSITLRRNREMEAEDDADRGAASSLFHKYQKRSTASLIDSLVDR